MLRSLNRDNQTVAGAGMIYDCIVIGGGVVGSSAAYHLSLEGKNVLLLEQFSLPHTRGSSHGPTRIWRASYDVPIYAHMTKEALQPWKRLEQETNTCLYRKTGLLLSSGPPFDTFNKYAATQRSLGDYKEVSREEFNREHSGTMKIPDGYKLIAEEEAGTLRSDKALDCLRQQIKHFGGEIRDEEQVKRIFPGPVVTVLTSKGEYKTRHLVITPGAWINQLLQPLGLTLPFHIERISVCYFKEKVYGSTRSMPSSVHLTEDIYSLPSSEYNGLMKICNHSGPRIDHPDHRDSTFNEAGDDMDRLCKCVRELFPGLETPPSIIEPCMYTVTPDDGFVMDSLPRHPNIVFGAGFSGHGFKMAPVVGRILCELAFGDKLSYDISPLRMNRFSKTAVSSNL